MHNKYEPLKWMKLNFDSENNKILLANTINKLMNCHYEDIVDGIMYINLAERTDRNTSMLENFKTAGIPDHLIHRIDAVLNTTCGHLGCTDSHIKALEYAKEKKWKRFLILEDDTRFTAPKERILYILSEFLKLYKDNWDVFMLYTYWTEQLDMPTDFIKQVVWGTTTTSYMVNEHYRDILLQNFKEGRALLYAEIEEWKKTNPSERKYTTNYALDQFWFKLQRTDKWYITNPYLCDIKNELYSSIMS
jgi:glycosyl transferase family 25